MKKLFSGIGILLSVIVIFSSCGIENQPVSDDFIYNGLPTSWMTSGSNQIYSRANNTAQIIDWNSGKTYQLIRDPFFDENENNNLIYSIFSDEQNLYYLFCDSIHNFRIIRMNQETFEEDIIYEKVAVKEQRDIFLGAIQTPLPDRIDMLKDHIPNRFAVFENKLFLFYGEYIQAVDLKTRKEKMICNKGLYNGNYGYYRGVLYFINFAYDLYSYHIQEDHLERIENLKARALLVTPMGIYYANANNQGCLYFIDFVDQSKKQISDSSVYAMDFEDSYLYFLSQGDDALYRVPFGSTECQKVKDLPGIFDVFCARNFNTVFLLYDKEGNFAVEEYHES